MKELQRIRKSVSFLVVLAATVLPGLHAEEFEAVSSRVSPDYIRVNLPDGSFQSASYAFGKGGYWSGPLSDGTIDKMEFTDVAGAIAVPLSQQHYFPSKRIE